MKTLLIIIITSHLGTAPAMVSVTEFNAPWTCESAMKAVKRTMRKHDHGVPHDDRHKMTIECVRR